jgi:phage terminase large subunit-like protein
MYIAARGQGKSFLVAIFCVVRCILYPGTKICLASKSRKQATEIIEKIKSILMPNSENLRNEIKDVVINQANAYIEFHNNSKVTVVTANDNARSK